MALDKDKQPIYFSRAAGERIREAVRAYERGYRNDRPLQSRGPRSVTSGLTLAKTAAGGITAMSGGTVGSGQIEIYNVHEDNTTEASGIVVTCRNIGGAVAGNKFIMVGIGPWGWWTVLENC